MKFSGLKDVLKTFDEYGWKGSFTRESWTIGNGGYDCWFELYYKGQPVATLSPGCLKVIHTQMSVKKESFFLRSSKFTLT